MPERKRRLLKRTSPYRKLAQMYEQLFPNTADRVWAMRNALGMTQAEMGELCGMTGSFISRLECGYGLPKGSSLQQVVEATGLSSDFILGIEAKVRPEVIEQANRFLAQAANQMSEGGRR